VAEVEVGVINIDVLKQSRGTS